MDTNDQFTRRDAKADTSDIPVVTGADLADERARRAMSYRERQRQESQRRAKEAAARGETYAENPYINSRRQTGGVSYDRFDMLDNFEEEARRARAVALYANGAEGGVAAHAVGVGANVFGCFMEKFYDDIFFIAAFY